MDRPSTIALIFWASVAEPWRTITTIHTRDPEKDLHMKDQAETASGKKEGDLKGNRPGNVQDRHHYPHLPQLHTVPREAEHLPASQAKVLDSQNDRILLQAGICLAKGIARMPGVAPMVAIIPPVSTVGNLFFWLLSALNSICLPPFVLFSL